MTSFPRLFFLIAVTVFFPSAVYALDVKLFQFKLDNGMQVIVIPDHRSQIVTHSVWYKVGAADEISGKTGLSHFLEHLMFKGTVKHPYGEFDRFMDLNGAYSNAFTTQDNTSYFQQTTADRLPLMMELESDRMQNLVLTEAIVKPELDVVREERRSRTESDPRAMLREQADAAMFSAHPYGRPTVGWMSEVATLTMDDALNFYHQYYTPANAVLIVGGDVEPDNVLALAKSTYGVLKSAFEPVKRVRTAEPYPIVTRHLTMTDQRAGSPLIMRCYLVPSYSVENQIEAVSGDFLAQILGGGVRSRLNQELVLHQKLAVYAGSYVESLRDYGKLWIFAAPNPGVEVDKLESAVDVVIGDLIKKGVTGADVKRTRDQALAEQVYALDSQMALVQAVGRTVINDQDPATAFDTSDWDKVTPETIAAMTKRYIRAENSVTVVLQPGEKQ